MIKSEWAESVGERIGSFRELQKEGLIPLNADFYPAVHYPGITMYPPITEEEVFKGYSNPEDNLFTVYAHIPFCMRYCSFCHYPVKIGDLTEEKDYYLKMLEKEMDLYMKRLSLRTIKVRSILVGGGTPTFLAPAQLDKFLHSLRARTDLTSCTQFSYDVDPSTLLGEDGMERIRLMKSCGVNRLTIGIQSFDDKVLEKMNRPHNANEAVKAVERAKEAGFKINIEFIYGYFGQTLDSWIETMEKAITLGAEEIQIYRIKIIPYGDHTGTITKMFSSDPAGFVPIEEIFRMKEIALLILSRNGYHENLRRVFSRDAKEYSHYADDQCCKLFDQVGFGLTAFSSLRDRFILNTQHFNEYYSLIKQGKLPIDRGLIRTKDDQLRWAIILPLKNREVYKSYYRKITGVSPEELFRNKIEKLKEFNLLHEDNKMLRLTTLGAFFADEVCQQFYHPRYMPFAPSAYAPGRLNPFTS